jgi:FeS assembly SUF system regulator
MLRITKQADYGIVLLGQFARLAPGEMLSAKDLAAETGIPQPMVGKILKQLVRDGLLGSQRGVHGGYQLTKRPSELSLVQIIECLEGPIAVTACCDVVDAGSCQIQTSCRTKVNWRRLSDRIHQMLAETSLADMIEVPQAAPKLDFEAPSPNSPAIHAADTESAKPSFEVPR